MASGTNASVVYGFELSAAGADNFGLGGTAINKVFGTNLELSTVELDRSINFRYGPGSRNWTAYKAGKVAGSWKADFDFMDPWIIESIIGGHSTITGTSGAYATTFSEVDVLSSLEIDICQAVVPATTYSLRKLKGCVINSASFGWEGGADEPVKLSLDGVYADEALSAPGSFTAQAAPQQASPICFANCALATSSNGTDYTTIANLDKCDIKIDQGAELKWSGGSMVASRRKFGERKYELSLNNLFDSTSEFLTKVYGASGAPSGTNPTPIPYVKATLSAETSATMSWIFTNVIPTKHGQPIKGPADELMEDVELTAQGCSVVLAGWDNTEPVRYQ